MEHVALILVCALIADSIVVRQKLRDLTERIKTLEKAAREE